MRPAPMRGYSDIMNTSDNPSVELHGNGQRVTLPHEEVGAHTLWKQNSSTRTPIWHLRVTVLKDGDIRGDCPNRIFSFKTLEDVTRAINQIEAAFGNTFELKKCGIDSPDAMGGRVNDGRSENITIQFDSDVAKEPWNEFLVRLRGLEDNWLHAADGSNI
ncbi:hypothetical protein MFRU_060g00110 [Monilinia fructicola]|uniref:Uncharacterized protein n=1 Tax=Monilinia fructicola TaxID=38448 RepID=A0A5M9JUT2_MONFR|nr:hypothetical protein EYC84_002121 [Monilinia fructicola]KAG4025335.1 hypothetical protein MFRU_060g00110 [Monilinia fructicola]